MPSRQISQRGGLPGARPSHELFSLRHRLQNSKVGAHILNREEMIFTAVRRMEVRSNRLNGSGMNKIVRSWSATRYSIMRSRLHVQIYNRCDDLACCVWQRTTRVC